MKTFLMIYDENTKELIDEYEEINDPQTTFNNWYIESDVSFEAFKNIIAFYFIGSVNEEDRKSGVIKFAKVKSKPVTIEMPLYFTLNDDGLNFIYHRNQNILWDDIDNCYLLAPDIINDDDELIEFLQPIDVLIPSMDAFFEVKIKYHFFISQRGRNFRRVIAMPLKYKSFYKKCKICKNITVLNINDMIHGKKVNCKKCVISSKKVAKKNI